MFDEQFNYVSSNSGFEAVGGNDVYTTHTQSNLPVTKNGFLYIYTSNETPNVDVFFDNLQVTHTRGQMLEETHYYPFGLTMAGISSKAAGAMGKRKGFNGNELQNQEFSDQTGLELYDFNARTYDPQIGRFLQLDPKSEEDDQDGLTPYHFTANNPIGFSDPDGKNPIWVIYRGIRILKFLYDLLPQPNSLPNTIPATFRDNTVVIIPVLITPIKPPAPIDAAERTVAGNAVKKMEEQAAIEKKINSLKRGIRSEEKNIKREKEKLEKYRNDPDKEDEQGKLKDATPEQRESIIKQRIKHLNDEIKASEKNIKDNLEKIKELEKKQE